MTEISKTIGLHKSTTAGIMNTLRAENFLEKDEHSGKYRLGLDIFRLAVNSQVEFNQLCEPYLDTLLELTGETVNLAVRDGMDIVYVAKKESLHSMRISTRVGMRLPIYCTAIGKAILSVMNESQMVELVRAMELVPFTENTITSSEQLIENLRSIRNKGIAYDFEELEYGLVCVAAPVYHKAGVPIGAVSVSGPSIRMDDEKREYIEKKLLEISASICAELYRAALL